MGEAYATLGEFVLFRELLHDELGHTYRAGELGEGAWRRTVWLRVFDGPAVPKEALAELCEVVTEIGGQLKAANVAGACELRVADGVPVLAWDYVPGQPLATVFQRVRQEGFPIPVDNALLIAEKLALALTAGLAYERDGNPVIHGFLHPGLAVVTNEGEALVAGLGLGDALLGALDDVGFREVTAPYLAPETLSARTANRRTDVYSLGSLLFQLLTGAPLPADPAQREAALDRATIAYDDSPIPDDIMPLLRRSLSPRPEERFSSAADFKKELDKLLFGGNYSPTTFNLALFMDRLFRSDIEREERERLAEKELDPAAYLRPVEETEETGAAAARGGRTAMWLAVAAALVAVAAGVVVLGPRLLVRQQVPPTPTAEELAAKKAAEKQRVQAMVQEELQRILAERQATVQQQLEERQREIEKLRAQLAEMERAAPRGRMTAEQQRQRQQLEQRLARAQQEQQAVQARLQEQARAEAEQAVRQRLAQTPTPPQRAAEPTEAPTARPERPTATPVPPTASPVPPTATPAPQPTATPTPKVVRPGAFFPPEEVDTLPVILRRTPVRWPRIALNSRVRGIIVLEAKVDEKGRVTDVRVLRADHSGYGIPAAASEAVRKYRFRPGTKNGVAVTTYASVAIPYDFRSVRRR